MADYTSKDLLDTALDSPVTNVSLSEKLIVAWTSCQKQLSIRMQKRKRHNMRKIWLALGCLACTCLIGTNAYASLELNDPGVVGIVDGILANSNPDTETAAAQHLLDMLKDTTDGQFQTSSTEYVGAPTVILSLGVQTLGGAVNVPAGWDYVMGKYDGEDDGYVLWYLGGAAITLPTTSEPLWVNDGGVNGFGLSHFTAFNAVPEPTTVIAGALLLLPFGLSTLQMIRKRRAA
jgi:hypothetical protein